MRGIAALLACVVAGGALCPARAAFTAQSLDDCDTAARLRPADLTSYQCYWLLGRKLRAGEDAARRLRAQLAIRPSNDAARLYLGLVEAEMGKDAGEMFRQSAEGFAASGNREGEVYALISLVYYHDYHRNRAASGEALERARAAADASGDPALVARLDWQESRRAFHDADYGKAWALARKAEDGMPESAPSDLRVGNLAMLGAVCWATGRHQEAMDYYRRTWEAYRAAGDRFLEAASRADIALLASRLGPESGLPVSKVRELLREAFDLAVSTGNRRAENMVRLLLAQDRTIDLSTRIAHVEAVLATEVDPIRIGQALRLLGALRGYASPEDPAAGFEPIERAYALGRERGDAREIAYARVARMHRRWETGPRATAIEDSFAALDAIERIRDLQRDPLVRARWFGEQAFVYYQVAGHILETGVASPSREDLDLAFTVMERLRARALLDALDSAHVTESRSEKAASPAGRDEVVAAIVQAQRKLIAPGLSAAERAALLREIDALETKESQLHREAELAHPSFVSIAGVQSLLAADEAMLAFQVSTRRVDDTLWWSNGGSWVFVVTRDDVRVLPLPDVDLLRRAIDVFTGMAGSADGRERGAAARLHEDLVRDAIEGLPQGVRRLVIVPDRDLHRVPFDALRADPDADPLAARLEITIVPSATVWSRWKRPEPSRVPDAALVLADPALGSGAEPASFRQAAPWVEGLQLGPLPRAREEAARLNRLLGNRCRLLEGPAASERDLKETSPAEFGVLVFASHAVLDEAHPERSAVMLAAGAPGEDGLLQPREIAGLHLDDRLVVLSSCSSAAGTLLGGEGVVGLSRAFLEAGARSVVASLWPMRDDEAASMAGAFYERLGEGKSVRAAMAEARRDRIRAGASMGEWAGFVVLGDGDMVPFPSGSAKSSTFPLVPTLLAAAALVILALVLVRRRSG